MVTFATTGTFVAVSTKFIHVHMTDVATAIALFNKVINVACFFWVNERVGRFSCLVFGDHLFQKDTDG
jgi:hypothetical protein